jgi:branched-chain amino acid transport system ATP-binding protein
MAEHLLEMKEITVRFGGLIANDGISFDVAAHQISGVIGPNGAGKSTLMNVVSGFVKPRSGTVTFDGRLIDRARPPARARLGLGRTFQVPRLFRGLTVAENLSVAARQTRASRSVPDDVLEACGVGGLADYRVEQLDGGQQRFVELARCLATRPRLVLLDEPTTGLRENEIERLGALLKRLRDEFAVASLIISHDMTLIHAACDHVAMLNFGRLITQGTAAEVCRDSRVVDAYLGQSPEVHAR